jgi:hypothetical protein
MIVEFENIESTIILEHCHERLYMAMLTDDGQFRYACWRPENADIPLATEEDDALRGMGPECGVGDELIDRAEHVSRTGFSSDPEYLGSCLV